MTRRRQERARWWMVVLFAVAMAWVESASVHYLRVLVDRVEPYQTNPLPLHSSLGAVELVREAATLVMLAMVALLAGRTKAARLGYAAIAFGVWDIFYYVFLRAIDSWPRSPFDWDILFLLPLPWWGPVIAPVSVAVLMIVGGTLATQVAIDRTAIWPSRRLWRVNWLGIALALYVFMADSLDAVRHGVDVTTILPVIFDWPLFIVAFALMAAPVFGMGWRLRTPRPRVPAAARSIGVR